MPRGVRKTKEQMIADLEAKLAKLKNENVLDASNEDVKKLADSVKKIAAANNWKPRELVNAIRDIVAPTKKRDPKA